jgi:hypothetical protein
MINPFEGRCKVISDIIKEHGGSMALRPLNQLNNDIGQFFTDLNNKDLVIVSVAGINMAISVEWFGDQESFLDYYAEHYDLDREQLRIVAFIYHTNKIEFPSNYELHSKTN